MNHSERASQISLENLLGPTTTSLNITEYIREETSGKKIKNERMSALARANEFPKEYLRASGEKLMCDACLHPVSWDRKDTVSVTDH